MIIWNKEGFSYSFIMKWFKERKMKKKIIYCYIYVMVYINGMFVIKWDYINIFI